MRTTLDNLKLECGKSNRPLRLVFVTLLFCAASFSSALPSFLDEFTKFYKPAPGTELFNAKCVTCHGVEGHTVKNAYGKEIMAMVQAKGTLDLTDDMLISIENKDSDGDGYTNLEEIISGTLPGDPKSHPAAHPDPKKLPKRPAHLPIAIISGGLAAVIAVGLAWILFAKRSARHKSD